MAAPKASSELGQSWPELITAAVLLFVPPPQDGVAFGTLYQVADIYRLTYIVHLHVPLYGSTIFFPFAREISSRLDRVSPRGRLLQLFLILAIILDFLPFPSSSLPFFFGRFYNVELNCSTFPGVYATLRRKRRRN